jgi:hypothetical protein
MPTDQPSSAPETIGEDARDPDTPAAVLRDEALDQPAGGGGLLGSAGGDPLAARIAGGETPNSPIDTGVAPPEDSGKAAAESRVEAVERAPAEPRPGSR